MLNDEQIAAVTGYIRTEFYSYKDSVTDADLAQLYPAKQPSYDQLWW